MEIKMILGIIIMSFFCSMVRNAESVVTSVSITGTTEVTERGSVTLTCNGTCTNSSCQYNWSPTSVNNNVLQLTNVLRNQANESHTCTVTDSGDQSRSSTKKTLTVYYGPDSVAISPTGNLTVNESSTSDSRPVRCSSECNPMCTITWTGSSNVSPPQNAFSVPLFPTNRILLRDDAKSYTCSVRNVKTNITQNARINLIIQYAPTVNISWNDSTKQFSCVANGVPAKYFDWWIAHYVDGTLVRNLSFSESVHYVTANISSPTFADTGTYRCEVSNGIQFRGSFLQKNEVPRKFQDKPQIVLMTDYYNVSKGEPLDINLTVYSVPEINNVTIGSENFTFSTTNSFRETGVILPFHGVTVKTTGQLVTIHITAVPENFFTNVTVTLTNNVGSTKSRVITILPQGPPDVPSALTVISRTHNSVTVSLTTGFFNGGAQTLVVQYKLSDNTTDWENGTSEFAGIEKEKQISLQVTGLKPETQYDFRSFAYNQYAESNYTVTARHFTDKEPVAVGAIVGGILGGLLALALVVLLVIYLKRRMSTKEREDSSHVNLNKDMTLNMPTSPTDVKTSVTPVKTPEMEVEKDSRSEQPRTKERLYENSEIGTKNSKPAGFHYYNVQKSENTRVYSKPGEKGSYIELVAEDKVEEAYVVMNVNKPVLGQISEKPYENTNISKNKDTKDYINVDKFKVKQQDSIDDDGTYLEMELNSKRTIQTKDESKNEKERPVTAPKPSRETPKKKRDSELSMPEYQAPPPPRPVEGFEEEQYINLHVKKRKS